MKNLCKTLTALLCAVCLMMGLTVPALAAIPNRPSNQYVLDDAGVLSNSTEDKIVAKNKELFEKYGAEVVIVAVDFLGGKDIDDYAYDLFNDWGIGSSERNNGILLVLAIAEDDYYALSGYGLEDYFDGAKFRELLDDCLEDDFAGGDYDRGVQKFFDKVVDEIEDYYDGYEDEYTQRDEDEYIQWNEDEYFRSGPSHWSWLVSTVGRFVVLVIVIIFLVSVFGRNRGGRGGPPYGGGGGGGNFWAGMMLGNMMGRSHRRNTWGAPPPPPPPRGGFGGGPRPGGFSGGGRSGGFGGFTGGGRTGGFGGRSGGGGFHGGGGSHGGGAGRR